MIKAGIKEATEKGLNQRLKGDAKLEQVFFVLGKYWDVEHRFQMGYNIAPSIFVGSVCMPFFIADTKTLGLNYSLHLLFTLYFTETNSLICSLR